MLAYIDRQVITLVAAPIAKSLTLTDTQLGAVQGLAFAIFTVIATYPLAWLADRYDRRVVLGLCVLLWSAGTAACGLAQNFMQLFVAAVIIAAGEAGLVPIGVSIIPDLFSGRQRVIANSINYFASYLGVSLALFLGGATIAALDAAHAGLSAELPQLESWRIAFLLLAAAGPFFLIPIAFMQLRRPVITTAPGAPGAIALVLPYVRTHYRTLSTVFVGLALYVFAFGGFLSWLPVANARQFGTTAAQNGFGMGIATGAGVVVGVTLGTLLMRRYQRRLGHAAALRIAWVGMSMATPVLIGFPFVTAAWQSYVLMGLLMTVGTMVGVLVPNILQDIAPSGIRARVIALFSIANALFGSLSPMAVGAVSDRIPGHGGLFTALTIMAVPAWLIATAITRIAEKPFVRTASWVIATKQGGASADG